MKVLFGNCSHSEAPLIEKALSMGWRASSVGNDGEALLASSMTRFFKGDFALPDIYDSAVEELRRIVSYQQQTTLATEHW